MTIRTRRIFLSFIWNISYMVKKSKTNQIELRHHQNSGNKFKYRDYDTNSMIKMKYHSIQNALRRGMAMWIERREITFCRWAYVSLIILRAYIVVTDKSTFTFVLILSNPRLMIMFSMSAAFSLGRSIPMCLMAMLCPESAQPDISAKIHWCLHVVKTGHIETMNKWRPVPMGFFFIYI